MTEEIRDALRLPDRVDAIDVSSVQVIHDFQAVADAGFRLVTCKASEGQFYCDPRVLGFLDGFRKVGLYAQVYGFARPSQGHPREQARKLFACAGDTFPTRPALDLENGPDDWTDAMFVDFAEAYVDECMQIGWLAPEVYSYPSFVRRRLMPALARSTILAPCGYWAAEFPHEPWAPPAGYVPWRPEPFARVVKHQYSGNGGFRVRGIYGAVDRDLFLGDEAALRAYLGLPDAPPAEAPIVPPPIGFPPRPPPTDE